MIRNILCIEDDRLVGEMYVRSLQHAGFQVDWYTEGDAGLVAAKTGQYDLILLDIMLPQLRGSEILHALRGEQDLIPKSKLFIMTNFEQDAESRTAMEHKADAYLIKAELTPRKLIKIIKDLNDGEDPVIEG